MAVDRGGVAFTQSQPPCANVVASWPLSVAVKSSLVVGQYSPPAPFSGPVDSPTTRPPYSIAMLIERFRGLITDVMT